jgi:hypothetical protein
MNQKLRHKCDNMRNYKTHDLSQRIHLPINSEFSLERCKKTKSDAPGGGAFCSESPMRVSWCGDADAAHRG